MDPRVSCRRQDAFACSPIYNVTPGIFDVRQGSRDDICYVIDDPHIDRKDNDDALLAFLQDKYPANEFLGFRPRCALTTIDARGVLHFPPSPITTPRRQLRPRHPTPAE